MEESAAVSISELEHSVPQAVLDRLSTLLTTQEYEATLRSFANPKQLTFRVNTILASQEEVIEELHQCHIETKAIPWCPLGYQVTKGSIRELQDTESYTAGKLYIQSASSMLSVLALQVQPKMRVLDMCAAPGSKTSQIATLMQNEGMLIANDRSRKRLYRLREILQQQAATNVEIIQGLGENLGLTHADCFDRVLVDVPCSGEGRFRLDRPVRLNRWNEQEINSLSKLQQQLLSTALRCVVTGGLVVYSTCTFAPEENELVLEKVLKKSSIDASLVPLPSEFLPPSARGPVSSWKNHEFSNRVEHALRIIPDETCTGFFVACIKRHS